FGSTNTIVSLVDIKICAFCTLDSVTVWVILAGFTLRWRKHWPAHGERDQPNRRLRPSAAGTILSRPARVLYTARLMIRSEKKRTPWALTKQEMKNCVWLKPELVAEIEFTEWTPDGHLRHSKFVGLRADKNAGEVVRED